MKVFFTTKSYGRNNQGAVALIVVIIVTVVALIIASNISLLSIGDLESGYAYTQSEETLALTDGCLEEVLRRLRLDVAYGAGGDTFALDAGSCDILVTGGGANKVVTATGTQGIYTKKISADVTISGTTVTLTSWSELSS